MIQFIPLLPPNATQEEIIRAINRIIHELNKEAQDDKQDTKSN